MNAVVVNLQEHAAARETSAIPDRGEYVARLRDILAALEADDQALFEARLGQLVRLREDGLFVNLAKLTRELHQAVRDLNFDERLQQLAGSEIPDACVRLDYVVKLGEDAAHRTLDIVDDSRRQIDALAACVQRLAEVRQTLPLAAQAAAGAQLEAIGQDVARIAGELRTSFSAVSQAQEYQDLSGQVIRRVIALVHNIEGALIKLLRATSDGLRPVAGAATVAGVPNGELAGPAVPGLANGAASQQDADSLLAELGF